MPSKNLLKPVIAGIVQTKRATANSSLGRDRFDEQGKCTVLKQWRLLTFWEGMLKWEDWAGFQLVIRQ
jgi:hypothetical protein